MRAIVFLCCFLVSGAVQAMTFNQLRAYIWQQGVPADRALGSGLYSVAPSLGNAVVIQDWAFDFPRPESSDLLTPEAAASFVAASRDALRLQLEQERQAAKPVERKLAENGFFTLSEQVLTAVSDERAGHEPPVKLGFSELHQLLEQVMALDSNTAIILSIRLLALDAELKRFSLSWWDDAQVHILE